MSRALIVGCGYLGRELARGLLENGWDVSAWTRSAESAAQLGSAGILLAGEGILPEPNPAFRLRVSAVDITDPANVQEAAKDEGNLDWVINCVSSGGGGAEEYRRIYLEGTRNLIDGLDFERILSTGSTSVYGQTDGSTVTEESPANARSATAQILLQTEAVVLEREGIVARLAGIYGPDRRGLLDRFRSGAATMDDDGARWLNTVHRDDAASALRRMLDASPQSGIWNVSDDGGVTQREAYQFLADRLGLPLPPSVPPDPSRKRGWTNKLVSNLKIRATGWQPARKTFLDGLAEQLAEAAKQ